MAVERAQNLFEAAGVLLTRVPKWSALKACAVFATILESDSFVGGCGRTRNPRRLPSPTTMIEFQLARYSTWPVGMPRSRK